MIRLKRIGAGIIGLHNHYHAFPMADYMKQGIPGVELVAVADERELELTRFAETYGVAGVYSDYHELLKRKDIDLVIVTSDTGAHCEHVLAAAAAGKHILLDKPISLSLKEADEMITAAEKADVKFMMAYLIRFNSVYLKVKQLIDTGVIGRVTSVYQSIRCPLSFITSSPYTSSPGWYVEPSRCGGGGFLDHGVHYTDYLRWLLGSEAVSVIGKVANLAYKDIPVDDYGIAIYEFNSGVIATVESTWHAADWYGPLSSPEQCVITGTEGEIVVHYQKSPQLEVSSRKAPYRGRTYFDWEGDERYNICYKSIVEHMVECIREDKVPSVTGKDGRLALEMILAAYEASRTGQIIRFPFEKRCCSAVEILNGDNGA
ncbi:MAG: Gfo/Idh/MocA family oxidoreductase [Firmicutes bacterium]|nr:Gfo/Idh/MocA family oxidoreductase [Bacillota bacterium]